MKWFLVVVASAAMLASSAFAASADEIIALSQKGVGEDVLLAQVEASKTGYNLTAADILKLKDAKVPDKVVTAMIKHKGTGVAESRPAPVPAPVREERIAPVTAPAAAAEGTLNIENVDDKSWAYTYEPDVKTLWITSANGDRGRLEAHGGISLRMAAGTYKVRYNGEDRGQTVTVYAGEKSLLLLSRVQTREIEALYVSVFEKGERKSGGRLVVLRENPEPRETTRREAPQPVAEPEAEAEAEEPVEPRVRERIVERERVVEVPSTTVIYRDPYPYYSSSVYVGPRYYYSGPRYYSGYSYPRYHSHYHGHHHSHYRSGYSSFGYSRYGKRSSVSVGIGFGF